MTESKIEHYSNLPLPFGGSRNKDTLTPRITPSPLPSSEKISRSPEKMSQTPVVPGVVLPLETQRIEKMESMLDRYDNAGSVPIAPIADEIAQLSAKQEGYSLEEGRFAPGSVRLNLPAIGITEQGHPVYPWISGEKGRELREQGIIMELPKRHKQMIKRKIWKSPKNAI